MISLNILERTSVSKHGQLNVLSARYSVFIGFCVCLVMNFQNIRDDFNQHVLEQTQAIEAQQMRQHLAEELERQDKMHAKTR